MEYIFKDTDIATLVENNTTLLVDGVQATVGTQVVDGQKIEAIANEGYEFTLVGGTSSKLISSVYFVLATYSGTKYQGFNLNDDNTNGVYEEYPSNIIEVRYLVCSTIQQAPEVTGSNNVYLINNNKLKAINGERLQYRDVNDNSSKFDYGNYILSVLQLPFKVPTELIMLSEKVRLGSFSTNVEADVIRSDRINIDLGTISVVGHKNNLLDYKNTIALLHLPRADPINIDLEYIIDQNINVKYSIDCYTGNATINITSSKTNSVVISKIVSLGISIPHGSDTTEIENINIDVGGDNEVLTPYIEIIKDDVLLEDGFFTIPIKVENELSDVDGYTLVENINLNTTAIRDYKDEIINILSTGVIIKKAP